MAEEERPRQGEQGEEGKGFKVSDRRFAVRGYVDEEEGEGASPGPVPAPGERAPERPAPPPAPPEEKAPPGRAEGGEAGEPKAPGEEAGEGKAPDEEAGARLFEMMVAILQSNALAAMGIHPQTGERVGTPDPRSARMFVELIRMVHEKMRGNLTPEEESLLSQVQSDLQMVYVQQVGIG